MKPNLYNLICKAQTGDSKAFAEVYSFYARDMYCFALSFMQNREAAEDCVQEAVLSCFKNIAKLKKIESFKSWMFTILANECKKRLTMPADKPVSMQIHVLQDLNESHVNTTELSAELSEALSSLNDEDRQIVLLSVIGGCKSREIGDMLKMPTGTVRSKLARSLKKLRDELQ